MVGGLTVAIHVNSQGGVTQFGQHACTLAGIGIMSPPFMYHQDAWAYSFNLIIIGNKAFHHRIALPVADFTGNNVSDSIEDE